MGQEVLGHRRVTEWLEGILASGRVGHAYLFLGAKGIGKAKVAENFAKGIVASGALWPHPDILEVQSSGQSISILQMRELTKQALLTPLVAERKVYIVHQAEKLTVQAANSLLQTLEEPPPAVVFILLANAPSVLPTIMSRCQVVRFGTLSLEETVLVLQRVSGGLYDGDALQMSARLSFGRPGEALRLLAEGVTALENIHEWVRHYLEFTLADKLNWLVILEKEQDRLYDYVYFLAIWMRDLLWHKLGLEEYMAFTVCAELERQSAEFESGFLQDKLQALHVLLSEWGPGIGKRMVLDQLLVVGR
ncbi:MAG: DNA polymerase III subunit tau [Firmicutes bacterium]|nr:DNA polymerase III subunit tau [Bacillota bacterium]